MRERLAPSGFVKTATIGLLWLAFFSLLYTLGEEAGAWPKPAPGAFRNLDLFIGFVAGVALPVALLRRGPFRFG
jgi:hypothetical protein